MANSFFQSLAPNIAAAVVKIDANKTELDGIRSTDIPGTNTKVDANKAVIDTNATNIGHIRNTAIPNVITEIDANETKIDSNTNTLQAVHTSVVFTVSVSDDLLISADTERSVLGTSYTKVKEIRIDYAGTYRFTFNTKVDGANYGFAKVYLNGATHGVEKSFNNTEYPNVESDDLVFAAGDLAQLYLKNGGAADNTFAKEFRVKGVLDTVIEPVIID